MQTLNLYSQLDRVKEPPFSARQQLWLVVAIATVMLLAYGWLLVGQRGIQAELALIQEQQRMVDESLGQLKAEKERRLQDNSVEHEVERLKQEVSFRRQLLASVDPGTTVMDKGFAGHLAALARQHVEGMWFTEIELQQGGQELTLLGRTRAPELVPRYLQRLSEESMFEGHQFRIFRMSIPETQKNVLSFELRAKDQKEQSSTGVVQRISSGAN